MTEARAVIDGAAGALEHAFLLAADTGIGLTRPHLRPLGTWHIPSVDKGSPYWSTLYYVEQSLDEVSGVIDGRRFIETIRQEPWQQMGAHYDLAIIHHDLHDVPERMAGEDPSFALSATEPNLAAVISVNRVRQIRRSAERKLALARLAMHSLGHIMEAVPAGRENAELSWGDWHCLNDACVMRHAPTVDALLDFAHAEDEYDPSYCDDCSDAIFEHLLANHFIPN